MSKGIRQLLIESVYRRFFFSKLFYNKLFLDHKVIIVKMGSNFVPLIFKVLLDSKNPLIKGFYATFPLQLNTVTNLCISKTTVSLNPVSFLAHLGFPFIYEIS